MRVCHVSWEYPPAVYGGLGRHVHALAEAQSAAGHDVTVITDHAPDRPCEETVNGVRIVRAMPAPPDLPFDTDHLLAWVLGLNHRLARAGITSWARLRPDVIHAHDWLVAHATFDLAAIAGTPTVATMHATEAGRHQGWLPSELSRSIHRIEDWLVKSVDHVITCSDHMESEVTRLFDVPADAMSVIPNGIDTKRWSTPSTQTRTPSDDLTLVYCGRLEWEKGVHTLLDAVAQLRRRFPELRLIIAGDGSQRESLMAQARRRRIVTRVTFAGWLPEEDLYGVIAKADAVVVPSIYEPFGLVALEAAALNTPLVISRTGGLAEFAGADATALTFRSGSVDDLVRAVQQVIDDPVKSAQRVRRARRRLREHHAWPALSDATIAAYQKVVDMKPSRVTACLPTPPLHVESCERCPQSPRDAGRDLRAPRVDP